MADHPNAELIRRGFDAFNAGDMETLAEMIAEDAVWHVPGRNVLSGDHRGRDAIFGYYFAKTMELTGGTFKAELHDALANDEHAVALHRLTASREGKTLDDRGTLVAHVRDGKLQEVWQSSSDPYAVDDFLS